MPDSVTVTVPARLHLGFFDLDATLGRRFGSVGVGLDRPVTSIRIARARRDAVTGAEQGRASRHLRLLRDALAIPASHALHVSEAIPSHAGLGSGTQLALAIAAGLRRLHGLPIDIRGDAERLDRGARSGVGIALFERGGLIVDGGRTANGGPPPMIAHAYLPDEWRILLLLDPQRQGVHGADEIAAFEALPAFSQGQAAHICHLVLMRMLPALAEAEIDPFGAAITDIQAAIGDHFAAAQGGRFASQQVAACLAWLKEQGIAGVGQSSWGPTGFAFMRSQAEAQTILYELQQRPEARGLELIVAQASTRGADMAETSLSEARAG